MNHHVQWIIENFHFGRFRVILQKLRNNQTLPHRVYLDNKPFGI